MQTSAVVCTTAKPWPFSPPAVGSPVAGLTGEEEPRMAETAPERFVSSNWRVGGREVAQALREVSWLVVGPVVARTSLKTRATRAS